MARLTRIQRLQKQNAQNAVRQLLKGSMCGIDSWLSKRRFEAARETGLSVRDVVRVEADMEDTMTDGPGKRDWVFGEIVDHGLRPAASSDNQSGN